MYAQCTTSWSESSTDNAAQWMIHKAKVRLLHERIKDRVEKQYGAELDALADSLVAHASELAKESEQTDQKREKLAEDFDKLFG